MHTHACMYVFILLVLFLSRTLTDTLTWNSREDELNLGTSTIVWKGHQRPNKK